MKTLQRCLALLCFTALAATGAASAQTWPAKPLQMIVPLAVVADAPFVFVVPASSPYKTLKERAPRSVADELRLAFLAEGGGALTVVVALQHQVLHL